MPPVGAVRSRTSATYEWFCTADLRSYRGKYVAMASRRVVASGKNAKRVLAQARKRVRGEIALWKVIDADTLIL